jgi:Ca-activated chloride channel family protein
VKIFFRIAIILLSAPIFYSCAQADGKLKMALGNFYYSRGLYVEAASAYFDALDYNSEAAYAEYALGCAYLAMEQSDAALERFQSAEKKAVQDDKKELIYRIRYNSGVVRFKSGDMAGAAESFKSALEADGSRMNAKLNLELSVLSLLRQQETAHVRTTQQGYVNEDNNRRKREILFEYVRKKETDKWKSWEWSGETNENTPDY